MIRSFYHHGTEFPATDLSREQMRAALADAGGVLWVDILAGDPQDTRRVLTRAFGVHPLTIRDCLDGAHRPKLEDYGEYIFFVVYADDRGTPAEDVHTVELAVYLGRNFVITHHPLPLPAIDRVAGHVTQDELLMARGADSLAYDILQAVLSDFQPAVDYLSAAIAGVEVEVLTAPTDNTVRRTHKLYSALLKARRALVPQQDILSRLASQQLQPVEAENRLYFRELAERVAGLVATIDALNESMRSARQVHLAVVANQSNRLLRLVAAMVAMLLPLTLFGVLLDTGVRTVLARSLSYADAAALGATLLAAILMALFVYQRVR